MEKESSIRNLGKSVSKQKEIFNRIKTLSEDLTKASANEKKMILSEIQNLKNSLVETNKQSIKSSEKVSMYKPLNPSQAPRKVIPSIVRPSVGKSLPVVGGAPNPTHIKSKKELKEERELSKIERETIKRMKRRDKENLKELKEKQKVRKPKKYVKMASRLFYKRSMKLLSEGKFKKIGRELVRGNLDFIPANYISFIFFTTLISLVVSFFIMIFFLFFNLVATLPIITVSSDPFFLRLLKVFFNYRVEVYHVPHSFNNLFSICLLRFVEDWFFNIVNNFK